MHETTRDSNSNNHRNNRNIQMNNDMLSTTTTTTTSSRSRSRWRPNRRRRRRRRRQCPFPPVTATLLLTALSLSSPFSFQYIVASAADTPNILSPIETATVEGGEAHVDTPDDPADVAATLDLAGFSPYGFQSGYFPDAPFYRSEILEEEEEEEEEERGGNDSNHDTNDNGRRHDLLHHLAANQLEDLGDDSFAGGMIYDAARNLVYFAGSTFGRYFDHGVEDSEDGAGNFGSHLEAGGPKDGASFQQKRGDGWSHLTTSDCFFGVLQLPRAKTPSFKGSSSGVGDPGNGNTPPWLLHLDQDSLANGNGNGNNHQNETVRLIYSRRFGTAHHSEACSALVALPRVDDALLQKEGQFKIALLGHVNPIPLSSQESSVVDGGGKFNGGLLSSLSTAGPVQSKARSYGFVADLDVSLVSNSQPAPQSSSQSSSSGAYGAFLGGYVLESSPLVYPVALAQNTRDPNQIYVVSMHADDPPADDAVASRYATPLSHEVDGTLRDRPDLTLGGSGGTGMEWMEGRRDWYLGGIPKYGEEFYVKVQALTVLPYQELMDVAPSDGEKVKRTFESGWGFGFKLNDAKDVRPSCIHFVKGRTPDDDLLLLAGTTRKSSDDADGQELDGFVTKLLPPPPSPVPDSAMQMHGENTHPTKRIDSTTGRDETVSFICLPPPNPNTGAVTHAFVVGSTTDHGAGESPSYSSGKGKEPSLAYILLMKLDDMSTIWKQRVGAIHPAGIGGNVLGEGCAVSEDGLVVYLTGTMDGGSALNTGNTNVPPSQPVGGTTDVFVVAYDVPFGNALWGKQLGTVYEDKLARGGGVSTDNEGNVMIMGTTRGALQRYRPEPSEMLNSNPAAKHPFAADIFFMSLSRVDGSYVNAPYTGPSPDGGTSPKSETASVAGAASDASENGENKGGLNGGVIAGIVIMVLAIVAGTSLFVIGRDRSSKRQQRMWNADDNGDDFSFDGNRGGGLGFRIGGYRDKFQSGVARGSDDKPQSEDWDDGDERIYATWMKKPQRHNDDNAKKPPSAPSRFKAELDSLKSAVVTRGSGSSTKSGGSSSRGGGVRPSLSNDVDDDHSVSSSYSSASSASRLRRETKTAVNKIFDEVDATDPRLDDGASIKNLLSHYREVRKGKLLDTDVDSVKSGSAKSSAPSRSGKKKDNTTGEGIRREGSSPGGGLSEFTIV